MKKQAHPSRLLLLAVCLLLHPPASPAQVPVLINYQGRLMDGTNLVNGTVNLALSLYSSAAGGTLLYTDSNPAVTVVDGLYATYLGDDSTFGNLDAALTNAQVWLDVAVDAVPLSPRERLVAVPYARQVHGLLVSTNHSVVLNPVGGTNTIPASIRHATIGGGVQNTASGWYSTVGGGDRNTANTLWATVGGGRTNTASGWHATVGGGTLNTAGDDGSTVGGGEQNIASGLNATVGGGNLNSAGGSHATIPGGQNNVATNYALAAGRRAKAVHPGAFVWGDSIAADVTSTTSNQVTFRATGGFRVLGGAIEGNGGGLTGLGGASLVAGSISNIHLSTAAVTPANVDAASFNTTFWQTGGNAGTTPGTHFLGTTDNQPFELHVNGLRALRIEPGAKPRIIGGHSANTAGVGATVAGGGAAGYPNVASGDSSFIGGGHLNTAGGDWSTVGGGDENAATGTYSTVGGGVLNIASFDSATVAGGRQNIASDTYATVGGGYTNTASGPISTVGGGEKNTASGDRSTVSGGGQNTANGLHATIAGGLQNTASGWRVVVSGGEQNTASADWSTVGGGWENSASGNYATIGGGSTNTASGNYSVVAGGQRNLASGTDGVVAGGAVNQATALRSAIGGGGGNTAEGQYATIPGGHDNVATNYALAAGRRAKAIHQGAFVWGDSTNSDITSTNNNSWTTRAAGGYRLFSDSGMAMGAHLPPNATAWAAISDREAKEAFAPVDTRVILEKVAALPLTEWQYKADPDHRRYIGPVAQDFHAAFGLGDDKTITTLDTDGVVLAAVQALAGQISEVRGQRVEDCDRMEALEAENARLKAELESIRHHLGL